MNDEENNAEESSSEEESGGNRPDKKGDKLKFLSDVPMRVSVELGSAQISVRELLQVQIGSVITVDKLAGEPLEFLINGRNVARGEVVVLAEKYGIRLTDIVNFRNIEADGRKAGGPGKGAV